MPFTSDGRIDAAGLAMSITGVILVVIAMRCTSRQEIWFTKELVYRSYVSDLKALLQIQEHWRLAWVPRQANSVKKHSNGWVLLEFHLLPKGKRFD